MRATGTVRKSKPNLPQLAAIPDAPVMKPKKDEGKAQRPDIKITAENFDAAALNAILPKLSDIANGIDRLRKAAGTVGDAQYSAICRELNLGSGSINDIPDRDTLQRLLGRVEAEAAGVNGNGRSPVKGRIGDARGRLLQAARRLAEKNGKRFADVIAEASDGKLSLDGLRDLTDADVALVLAATSRMAAGGDL
jgi:hypothetical protein